MLLAVEAARRRLEQHYGSGMGRRWQRYDKSSGWTTQQSKKQWWSDRKDPPKADASLAMVPSVPKEPRWQCQSCDFRGNFRCRIRCLRCAKPAADPHITEVLAESLEKRRAGASGEKKANTGGEKVSETGADLDTKREQLEEMQREIHRATSSGRWSEAILQETQKQLDEKRIEYRAAKPMLQQIKAMEHKQREAQGKLQSHREKKAALEKQLEEAREKLRQHEQQEETLAQRCVEMGKELAELRRKALQDGGADADDAANDDKWCDLPVHWRGVLETMPNLDEVLAQAKAAAQEAKQNVGKPSSSSTANLADSMEVDGGVDWFASSMAGNGEGGLLDEMLGTELDENVAKAAEIVRKELHKRGTAGVQEALAKRRKSESP